MNKFSLSRIALSLLDFFSRAVLAVFLLSILISAISTAALRYYLPRIDDYREEILATANQNTQGLVFSASSIQSQWRPFHPAFSFNHCVNITNT